MELCQAIDVAFADAPRPSDDRITICGGKECGEIADYFRGKTQKGHSTWDLRCHEMARTLFTDEAYRYFLPAFMWATIEDIEQAEAIPDLIVHSLSPSSYEPALRVLAYDRMRCLSPLQLNVVRQFLEWLQSLEPNDADIYTVLYHLARPIPEHDLQTP
jgi:hypothetical protein